MSTLDQLHHGVGQIRDSLIEGWQYLRERTLGAVTHFKAVKGKGDIETQRDQHMLQASRWALLAVEVYEADDAVQVRLEIPGMTGDDFDISVIDNYLVVRSEKQMSSERRQGRFHVMECAYGRFERAIELPARIDDSGARARYRNGVLTVTLPKNKASIRRKITVGEH